MLKSARDKLLEFNNNLTHRLYPLLYTHHHQHSISTTKSYLSKLHHVMSLCKTSEDYEMSTPDSSADVIV